MNDWMRIQSIFAKRVEVLQRKLPIYLEHRLLYDYQKVSFWIQACPGFDVKIYITPALIGTYVDQDHCDLSCDFDAGIEFTVRFTFNYFESLLTKKSRLCRWFKNDIIQTRSIDQWDGKNWMNTQGRSPKSLESYHRQFTYNDLNINEEVNDNNLNFAELLACEQN